LRSSANIDYVVLLLNTFKLVQSGDEPTWFALADPPSERELAVLRLLSVGLSTPEIAKHLIVGVSTVRTHIKHIYQKLDVHSSAEAIERE
jgi:LuxR family maltose regulon positive regulatory protein